MNPVALGDRLTKSPGATGTKKGVCRLSFSGNYLVQESWRKIFATNEHTYPKHIYLLGDKPNGVSTTQIRFVLCLVVFNLFQHQSERAINLGRSVNMGKSAGGGAGEIKHVETHTNVCPLLPQH